MHSADLRDKRSCFWIRSGFEDFYCRKGKIALPFQLFVAICYLGLLCKFSALALPRNHNIKLAKELTKKLARELTKKLVRLISCLMRSLMKKTGELRRHKGARCGESWGKVNVVVNGSEVDMPVAQCLSKPAVDAATPVHCLFAMQDSIATITSELATKAHARTTIHYAHSHENRHEESLHAASCYVENQRDYLVKAYSGYLSADCHFG
jgi:hypothetical protein